MSVAVRPHKGIKGKWMVDVRVEWPSGSKVRVRKVVDRPTESQARKYGEEIERGILTKGETVAAEAAASTETVSEFYARYYKAAEIGRVGRKNAGRAQSAIADRVARFTKHIEPRIGHRPMAAVTSDELRDLVEALDEQVRERVSFYDGEGERTKGGRKPGMSWKTAAHVWSEVTSGFREAVTSKLSEMRILKADPTRDVRAPMKTEERTQAALYPSEARQLLTCERIPLGRRRVYALSIYLGTRLSELANITAADVDFTHGLVTVNGSKTNAARRRVPMEPALRPLLVLLCEERPEGPLVDVPANEGRNGAADLMGKDIETAGLERADLTRDDGEMMRFTFHGLRHSFVTWAYVAGRDATWLKVVAGHTSSVMTQRYLDSAAMSRSTFGVPFGPLPKSILGGGTVHRLTKETA
jgi:integrase